MSDLPRSLSHYLKLARRELGPRLPVYLAVTLLATALDGVGLALFVPLFHLVAGSQDTDGMLVKNLNDWGIPWTLPSIGLLIVMVFTIKGAVKLGEGAYGGWLQAWLTRRWRARFLIGFSRVDYRNFTTKDAAALAHISGAELHRAVHAMFQFCLSLAGICTAVAYFVIAAVTSLKITLATLFLALIPAAIMRSLNRRSKHLATQLVTESTQYQSFVTELLHQAKYVLATDTASRALPRQLDRNHQLTQRGFKLSLLTALVRGLREPLLVITLCALLLLHAHWGSDSIDSMLFVLLLIYRLLSQLMAQQATWQSFLGTSPSIDVTLNEIEDCERHSSHSGRKRLPKGEHRYSLQNVCLDFESGRALDDVTFQVEPGEVVALLGPSGAGKSSAVNVLTGLLRPSAGIVCVDGIDLTQIRRADLQAQIGYITQEPVVFNDTVRNNITLWRDEPIPEALIRDAALHFVAAMPQGLDSLVGDRGVRLSGGQKQRICIARELYRQPSMLILDEATNALDADTEQIIRDTLLRLRGKTTIVLITHRAYHALDADRVIILDQGRVIEMGPPHTLKNRPDSHFYQALMPSHNPRAKHQRNT